jgi:SPP1 gp7 family putative phage head morphogenesis protein
MDIDLPLSALFAMLPEKAIEYFQSKGYAISWNWWDVWQEAQAKSFTVTRGMRQDILADIRAALEKALAEGQTVKMSSDNLEPVLKAKGWWGKQEILSPEGNLVKVQLGSPWRLKTIYRTNLQTSYMSGRYQQFYQNTGARPYLMYVAVMDQRTRPSHGLMNGRVFRWDDPIWKTHKPPLGFNCRCRMRALTEKQVERKGLQVESGQGKMLTKQVEVGVDRDTGEVIYKEITGYKSPSGILYTDVGWSYDKISQVHPP